MKTGTPLRCARFACVAALSYFGELLLDEAAGGQGVPEGVVPGVAELPWLLPEVEGDEPGLEDPGLDDPVFGAAPLGASVEPGIVPHGEPLGVVPGELDVFGFTVDG